MIALQSESSEEEEEEEEDDGEEDESEEEADDVWDPQHATPWKPRGSRRRSGNPTARPASATSTLPVIFLVVLQSENLSNKVNSRVLNP